MDRESQHNAIDKLLTLKSDITLDDFLEYLQELLVVTDSKDNSLKVNKQISDWDHWKDDYEQGDFDIQIFLSHRVILPPRHNFDIQLGNQRKLKKVQILYEYYFEHLAIITVENNNLYELMSYINSLAIIQKYFTEIDKKKASLRKIPFVGGLICRAFFSQWFGSSVNDQASFIEHRSLERMADFESWLAVKMPPEEKLRMKEGYEKYFKGVPDDMRGMYINY